MDTNQLVTLDILLAERNVTHAARWVNLSQPALSTRLARLREIFDDPLLLPAQRGMVPTQKAIELQPRLHEALEAVRQVVATDTAFGPIWSSSGHHTPLSVDHFNGGRPLVASPRMVIQPQCS
jgi:DNA-binding transcriptional LysR family regulator